MIFTMSVYLKAYNGFTSPASFTVVVRAVGPIRSDEVSVEERDFLRLICYAYIKVRNVVTCNISRYVVDAPRPPRPPPRGDIGVGPDGIYRYAP